MPDPLDLSRLLAVARQANDSGNFFEEYRRLFDIPTCIALVERLMDVERLARECAAYTEDAHRRTCRLYSNFAICPNIGCVAARRIQEMTRE